MKSVTKGRRECKGRLHNTGPCNIGPCSGLAALAWLLWLGCSGLAAFGQLRYSKAMNLKDAIESRRSIRKYTPDQISDAELQEILRLASLAPSAWNLQPWRFAIIKDQAIKDQLQAAAYNQGQVGQNSVLIAIYSDMEDTMRHAEETAHPNMGEEGRQKIRQTVDAVFGPQSIEARNQWALAQANIAFGFLMLAAQSMGYSSCPMLGFDDQKVRQILQLPEHVQFAGLLSLGKAAEEGHAHHRHDLARISKVY